MPGLASSNRGMVEVFTQEPTRKDPSARPNQIVPSYMHSMALRPHNMQLSDSRGLGYCGSRTDGGRAASAEHPHVDPSTPGCTRKASGKAPRAPRQRR